MLRRFFVDLVWATSPLALGLASGCTNNYCDTEGRCDCHGREECVISCPYDACDVSCSQTAELCGVVCGDSCKFECNDSNHCSIFSQTKSDIYCHSLPSCASDCGEDCKFRCENVSECTVHAGPKSTLTCDHAALCDVTCEEDCEVRCNDVDRCHVACDGPCDVELTCDSVGDCRLTCPDGTRQEDLGSGTYHCEEER